MHYLVGIDEAGRGPLAGPVAVGIVKISLDFKKNFFKGIKDSKKLTAIGRELWFARALDFRKAGKFDFAVSLVSEKIIDRKGIVYAISLGIKKCLITLEVSKKFPKYNFHIHKGYGTSKHRQAIKKYGLTVIHRRSFLKTLTST